MLSESVELVVGCWFMAAKQEPQTRFPGVLLPATNNQQPATAPLFTDNRNRQPKTGPSGTCASSGGD